MQVAWVANQLPNNKEIKMGKDKSVGSKFSSFFYHQSYLNFLLYHCILTTSIYSRPSEFILLIYHHKNHIKRYFLLISKIMGTQLGLILKWQWEYSNHICQYSKLVFFPQIFSYIIISLETILFIIDLVPCKLYIIPYVSSIIFFLIIHFNYLIYMVKCE